MPRIRCPQSVYFTVETLQNAPIKELKQEKKAHKIKSRNDRQKLQENLALHYMENHGWTLEEFGLFSEKDEKILEPLVGSKRKRS